MWNHAYSQPAIRVPPYSVDDQPAFSELELRYIIQMWRAVAEDYSPWDVS